MTTDNPVSKLGKALESVADNELVRSIVQHNLCVEAACAMFSKLHPAVENIKLTLLISELVDEATNDTQAKVLSHAYLEANGETLDIQGRNAVERYNEAFPETDENAGPDNNGCIHRFYRIEMDMSTEARRIAALQTMRQTCEELGQPLDEETTGAISDFIGVLISSPDRAHLH